MSSRICKRVAIIVLISIFLIVLGGCRLPSKEVPLSTLLPPALTATYANTSGAPSNIIPGAVATKVQVLLPIVMRLEQDTGSVPLVMSTPTLAPTFTPEPPAEITLLFTGVIVPARCVEAAIDEHGDANYIFNEVRQRISSADLAIGTLNATLSDASTHTGCIETYVLVGDSRSAVALANAGFDVMSVATNHIKNCAGDSCGDNYNRAFTDTMDNLRANNILPVGAGMNASEALQPVVVEVKGIRFGFVSLGMVEPMAFAGENSPGIAELTDDNLRQAISAAKRVSDVVIAMPHWGPEDLSNPNSYQLDFAQVAVEAGADVVMGNHTHVVQAIQQINGIDVFYGLGNFVFDQTWDLGHQQGVMLLLHFIGKQYTGYDLIPTHVDGDGTVHIASPDEATEILKRIEDASKRLK
jgi:hypothetical protein